MRKAHKVSVRFAVCIKNKGYEASLEKGKLYRVVPDQKAEGSRLSPHRRREWRGLRRCRQPLLRDRPTEVSGEGAPADCFLKSLEAASPADLLPDSD